MRFQWYDTQPSSLHSHLMITILALYAYECLITLLQEVNVIWRRKWSIITWVYTLTRYATALITIRSFLPAPNLLVR